MRRNLTSSVLAIVVLTVLFGLVYPLAFTGVSQILFPGNSNGSKVSVNGHVVGSRLIAQSFHNDPRYFQPRPSQSDFDPSVTFFSNAGPNSKDAEKFFAHQLAAYLQHNRRYDPSLTASQVPVDAVTTSASGVDPDISPANAAIQAHRVAAARHLPLSEVQKLIDDNTDGRALGVFGEPGVNVLELNLALDNLGGTK